MAFKRDSKHEKETDIIRGRFADGAGEPTVCCRQVTRRSLKSPQCLKDLLKVFFGLGKVNLRVTKLLAKNKCLSLINLEH